MVNIARMIEDVVNEQHPRVRLRFTQEEKEYLLTHLKKTIVPKGAFVLRKGDKEKSLYFLEKGLIRVWLPDTNNNRKEYTIRFIHERNFLNLYYAMKHKEPALANIEATTDCVVWKINRESLMYLMDNSLNINKMARVYLEKLLDYNIKRELAFLTKSPEERYIDLLGDERKLILNTPLKQIASYIGITPQALSNIRKRILIFS